MLFQLFLSCREYKFKDHCNIMSMFDDAMIYSCFLAQSQTTALMCVHKGSQQPKLFDSDVCGALKIFFVDVIDLSCGELLSFTSSHH